MDHALYDDKEDEYFSKARIELIQYVPMESKKILEIGCGDGATGALLKLRIPSSEVIGVEIAKRPAALAAKFLDAVHVGNVEDAEQFSLPYSEGHFDVLIAADVLEHLVDPWTTLKRLATLVEPNGRIVASIPNVQNWRVLLPLIFRGRWTYRESGLLDRTHLRFFTRITMVELLVHAGFDVVLMKPIDRRSRWLSQWIRSPLLDIFTTQFIVIGIKRTRSDPKAK